MMQKRKPQVTRPYRDRQAEALAYIREHVRVTGNFPTKVGIARAIGAKNPSSARDMLERLTANGHLKRVRIPHDGYTYELVEKV